MISRELLKWYPLFADLSLYLATEISLLGNEIEVERGEWLFYEEATAEKFYIVIEGSISLTTNIYLHGKAQDIEAVEPVGPRELLGWSALIKPYQYTLGARAREKSRLIEIEVKSFRDLMEDNPEFGFSFIKSIAELIRERMNGIYIQMLSLALDSNDVSVEKMC
jgi:CRP-like cAMP-binding protein